jgi:hypothetical protein
MAAEPTNRTEQRTNEPATEPGATEVTAAVDADAAVEATVTLRVPRGAMGDLPAGVHEVLAGVDGVETADVGEIRGVRPTSFDIRVDVAARLGMDGTTDPDAVRDRLLDGFGIEAVEAVVVDVG